MITKQLAAALNAQINHELYSSYLYLSMAAYCETLNLPGSAAWLKLQSQEERTHAMKLYDFMIDRGARVLLQQVDAPPHEFGTIQDVFAQVLTHEQKVTKMIYDLYEQALAAKAFATQIQLQWFVTEQVEEEKNAGQIVEQLKRVKDSPSGLLYLDRELGKRGAAKA